MSRECPIISPAISRCTPTLCLTAVLSPRRTIRAEQCGVEQCLRVEQCRARFDCRRVRHMVSPNPKYNCSPPCAWVF